MAFVPSTVGAPGGSLPSPTAPQRGSYQGGLLGPGQQEEQTNMPNFNTMRSAYDKYQSLYGSGASGVGSGATSAGSSALVTGGPGTGTAASYGGFGLGGASTGLTYGGSAMGASSGLVGSAGGAASGASTAGASYGLGGSLVGGTGTVGGSTFAGGAAGGSAAGGASAGGGMAAAGPWAALVAAIALNENYQKKSGNRDQGTGKQIEHAFTGKVVEDDASVWGEKIDSGNKLGIKGDMEVGADFATGDFSNAFKNLDETFGLKTIKKIFGG